MAENSLCSLGQHETHRGHTASIGMRSNLDQSKAEKDRSNFVDQEPPHQPQGTSLEGYWQKERYGVSFHSKSVA